MGIFYRLIKVGRVATQAINQAIFGGNKAWNNHTRLLAYPQTQQQVDFAYLYKQVSSPIAAFMPFNPGVIYKQSPSQDAAYMQYTPMPQQVFYTPWRPVGTPNVHNTHRVNNANIFDTKRIQLNGSAAPGAHVKRDTEYGPAISGLKIVKSSKQQLSSSDTKLKPLHGSAAPDAVVKGESGYGSFISPYSGTRYGSCENQLAAGRASIVSRLYEPTTHIKEPAVAAAPLTNHIVGVAPYDTNAPCEIESRDNKTPFRRP